MEVTIDIADDVFLALALTAHEKNVTLNTMVEYILADYIRGNCNSGWHGIKSEPARVQKAGVWQPSEEEEREPGESIPVRNADYFEDDEDDSYYREPTVDDACNERSCQFRTCDKSWCGSSLWRGGGRLVGISTASSSPFEIKTASGESIYAAFCRIPKEGGQ